MLNRLLNSFYLLLGFLLLYSFTPQTVRAQTDEFVHVCGRQLCLNGDTFVIHGATAYGHYQNPDDEVSLAKQAGLNTLELVEYETNWHDLNAAMSEDTWVQNDKFIATAKANGLHVVLNLSSYGHALAQAGIRPTGADWNPFLSFVMNRVNTVTGVRYADEPAIAKIQLYGEIAAPNYSDPMQGTGEETTAFYKRTLAQLKTLDPNHVISTGGFSYSNDQNSGIDWKTIMSDPNNAVCDVEINSFGDRNSSVPAVANYCQSMNKPWFLAAWSTCQGNAHFADDADHWTSDIQMANHAADMYSVSRIFGAAGTNFWNLGDKPAGTDNCDIGPQYPITFQIVQQTAP
jgi:hypothetical protein